MIKPSNRKIWPLTILLTILLSLLTCMDTFAIQTRSQQNDLQRSNRRLTKGAINKTIKKLKPLHTELGKPKEGEWLAGHKESGQTYSQYLRIRPNILTQRRSKLYVQPIGDFSDKQKELIKLSSEYLSLYFNCPVTILDTQTEDSFPASAKRVHLSWGDPQLLTSHILNDVLAPKLPSDAFATIAFTSSDLWPGDGWNFVFGYAAFRDRVGVWSLYRFGDPDESEEAFRKCLLRTIKVATHETGHMFSIQHCIKWQCNMQGSNSLPESDTQPLYLCPQCHAKILHATSADPIARYRKLAAFCETHQLADELAYFEKAIEKLK